MHFLERNSGLEKLFLLKKKMMKKHDQEEKKYHFYSKKSKIDETGLMWKKERKKCATAQLYFIFICLLQITSSSSTCTENYTKQVSTASALAVQDNSPSFKQ